MIYFWNKSDWEQFPVLTNLPNNRNQHEQNISLLIISKINEANKYTYVTASVADPRRNCRRKLYTKYTQPTQQTYGKFIYYSHNDSS